MKVTAMTFLIITASTTFSQIFAFSGVIDRVHRHGDRVRLSGLTASW